MRKKVKQNRLLCFMIILEVIALGVMGFRAITKEQYVRRFTNEEIGFEYEMQELVYQDEDGNMFIYSDNWNPEADAWQVGDFTLQPGRYRLIIHYVAENTIDYDNWVTISSEYSRNYLNEEKMQIQSFASTMEKEFMIMSTAEDVKITIHYGGYGTLGITGICIEENTMNRLGDWLNYLLFFIVLDVLYALLFGKELTSVSAEGKWNTFLILLTILFASFPMLRDIVNSGHDLYFHMGRIQGIADALRDGQFPVRIYSSANNGYGYACSLFYGEILLYLPAVLYLLGMPLFRAYQIYIIAVNTGTALISYFCFSRMFRNKKAGILGAFLYSCGAYRVICMTVRAAIGEFSAMMFLPLLFYAVWSMASEESTQKEQKYAFLWLALGITGLLQTHMITFGITVLFLILFCLVKWRSMCRLRNLLAIGKAALLTILLNLWFLIPFLSCFEGEYNVNSYDNYLDSSTLYLQQIFGVFFPYAGKNVLNGMVSEMPLTIGFSLTLGLIGLIAFRIRNPEGGEKYYKTGVLAAAFAAAAIWLSSIYCPWYKLRNANHFLAKYLTIVQFPWRYLTIAAFLLVITSICFVVLVSERYGKKLAGLFGGVLILVNILTVGYFYGGYLNTVEEKVYLSRLPADFFMDELYLPKGMDSDLFQEHMLLCDGSVRIEDYRMERGSFEVICSNMADTEQTITFPLVYYPEYCAVNPENGSKLSVRMGDDCRVVVTLPPNYNGTIYLKFMPPILWRICECISVITAVWLVVYMILKGRRKKVIVCEPQEEEKNA